MEFLIVLAVLALITGATKIAVVDRFTSGQIAIDQYKYPTLHRAQKILRANDTKAREKEQTRALEATTTTNTKHLSIIKEATQTVITTKQEHHKELTDFWDQMFDYVNKPLEEAATQKRLEAARQAWKEQEKKRLESVPTVETTPARTQGVPSLEGRTVSVHQVNFRTRPATYAGLAGTYSHGALVWVNGWATGEALYGNNIWYRINPYSPRDQERWVWSGAFDSQDTKTLDRVYPKGSEKKAELRPLNPQGDPSSRLRADKITATQLYAKHMDVTASGRTLYDSSERKNVLWHEAIN